MNNNIIIDQYKTHVKELFLNVYDKANITELAINKQGEFWYEENGIWNRVENDNITFESVQAFAKLVAQDGNKIFNSSSTDNTANLIFSTSFKATNDRIQVVAPPIANSYSITIRKPTKNLIDISSYSSLFDRSKLEALREEKIEKNSELLDMFYDSTNYLDFLKLAVKNKKTIIISGGTGSGKTTLMKSLMQEIPDDERLITIEDAPELTFKYHDNTVSLFYESEESKKDHKVTAQSLIKSTLRMKPDRILLAEIRGKEAYDFINVISNGHGGSITSLHADDILQTVNRLIMMINAHEDAKNLSPLQIQNLVLDNVDIIINIKNVKGKRMVNDIYFKDANLYALKQQLAL